MASVNQRLPIRSHHSFVQSSSVAIHHTWSAIQTPVHDSLGTSEPLLTTLVSSLTPVILKHAQAFLKVLCSLSILAPLWCSALYLDHFLPTTAFTGLTPAPPNPAQTWLLLESLYCFPTFQVWVWWVTLLHAPMSSVSYHLSMWHPVLSPPVYLFVTTLPNGCSCS